MKLGAHMPIAGGVWTALERGARLGCEAIQMFVKNNHQWFGPPLTASAQARFAAQRAASGLEMVFGHAGYLINLAGPDGPKRDKSIQSLIQEIQLAAELGLPFLVLHPGAHLGAGETVGLRRVVVGLDEVLRATAGAPVRLALENTAGQGTCLGGQLWHLVEIYQQVEQPDRLGLCLDTAHLFAAGYDIRTARGWNAVLHQIESALGLDQLLAMHLNDSATALGSRHDRHAHIGQGHLGRATFARILNDPRLSQLPGCLETPKSRDLHEDAVNLAVLRSLRRAVGGKD
jgi:deoxyribonuclease-4